MMDDGSVAYCCLPADEAGYSIIIVSRAPDARRTFRRDVLEYRFVPGTVRAAPTTPGYCTYESSTVKIKLLRILGLVSASLNEVIGVGFSTINKVIGVVDGVAISGLFP